MYKNDNKQIEVDGDAQSKYTCMSYKEISNALKRDISQYELVKIWKIIKSSLNDKKEIVSVLEGIAYFDEEFIVDNRLFLADIFELAESLSYVLYNDVFSREERDYIFNKAFEEKFLKSLDAETIRILCAVFDIEDIPLDICGCDNRYYSYTPVLQKFKILLENENILWVDYLKRAGELKPYDKEVITYLLDYALIIEDENLIKEYQQRLDLIEE